MLKPCDGSSWGLRLATSPPTQRLVRRSNVPESVERLFLPFVDEAARVDSVEFGYLLSEAQDDLTAERREFLDLVLFAEGAEWRQRMRQVSQFTRGLVEKPHATVPHVVMDSIGWILDGAESEISSGPPYLPAAWRAADHRVIQSMSPVVSARIGAVTRARKGIVAALDELVELRMRESGDAGDAGDVRAEARESGTSDEKLSVRFAHEFQSAHHGSESYFLEGEGVLTDAGEGRKDWLLGGAAVSGLGGGGVELVPPFRFSRMGPRGTGKQLGEPKPPQDRPLDDRRSVAASGTSRRATRTSASSPTTTSRSTAPRWHLGLEHPAGEAPPAPVPEPDLDSLYGAGPATQSFKPRATACI